MPRLKESSRKIRRDHIAQAALRCMQARGLADTSIADIVAESGLSPGAIYSHFASKSDLARYVAEYILAVQTTQFESLLASASSPEPADILRMFLSAMEDSGFPRDVLIQYWAAATTDPLLHEVVQSTARAISEMIAVAVTPWAQTVESSSRQRKKLALRTGRTMLAMLQGHIVHAALFESLPAGEYVDTAVRALTAAADRSGVTA